MRFVFDTNSLFKDGLKILKTLKQKAWDIEPEFLENLKAIQKIFGLTEAEKTFFAFVILSKFVFYFEALLEFFGNITMSEFVNKVSIMLELKKEELYQILSYDSVLFKVGLLEFHETGSSRISDKFSVLPGLVDEMFLPHKKPEEIFQNYLQKVQETKFTKEDFSHIEKFEIFISYLKNALKNQEKGINILLYGPPGTGKTEFARKMAEYLDKELLLKHASDLISPYVGETEHNIALMFEEARREKAVLLLDEADTFLLSRKDAKYSWEVSMVNELLTQMESFEGVFICATNFVEVLDEAVMRRFDLKVKFDYLGDAQKVKLFASLFGEKEAEKYRKVLSRLLLTPGNFATAYRKCKLMDENLLPESFVKALQEEAKFNILSGKRNLGFV